MAVIRMGGRIAMIIPACRLFFIERLTGGSFQDSDGRTAAHLAVLEQNMPVLESVLSVCDPSSLLLKDRYGASALAVAMQKRYNCAAEAIVKKAPHAVMQMNGSGENLLHSAVKSHDLESVLFLLALQTDVNVRTQDGSRVTALHMSAQAGDEMIMRNLVSTPAIRACLVRFAYGHVRQTL
ncbi:unnamed protein product [Toxocara canis]|uniref:ANK_REP_REGION domain-containing protein n=1 Tax=Toxocara canis TaxID=6265 RepID=A0A183U2B5_TOXCA|nr:unnamed protein product [Toxocara canis]